MPSTSIDPITRADIEPQTLPTGTVLLDVRRAFRDAVARGDDSATLHVQLGGEWCGLARVELRELAKVLPGVVAADGRLTA